MSDKTPLTNTLLERSKAHEFIENQNRLWTKYETNLNALMNPKIMRFIERQQRMLDQIYKPVLSEIEAMTSIQKILPKIDFNWPNERFTQQLESTYELLFPAQEIIQQLGDRNQNLLDSVWSAINITKGYNVYQDIFQTYYDEFYEILDSHEIINDEMDIIESLKTELETLKTNLDTANNRIDQLEKETQTTKTTKVLTTLDKLNKLLPIANFLMGLYVNFFSQGYAIDEVQFTRIYILLCDLTKRIKSYKAD